MITSSIRAMLTLLTVIVLFSSCKREFEKNDEKPPTNQAQFDSDYRWNYQGGGMVLGKHLQNPYTIPNMTAAYAQATANGASSLFPVNIRVTHYYVKYKPANEYQYAALESDSTLELYDYPLDYEITQDGNYYHDPLLPDSVPTYQYCTVPIGYHFNDTIQYEILASLYIPEIDTSLNDTTESNDQFIDDLMDQAFILTANYDDTIKTYVDMQRKPKWRPKGTILIHDTRLNADIGLEGVKVRARRWFFTYTGRTDATGYFQTDWKFRNPANYSIKFSTPKFDVRESLFKMVYYLNGPKKIGQWDYVIQDGYDRFVGHVFRGAYKYHYGDILGLSRPRFTSALLKYVYTARNKFRPGKHGDGLQGITSPGAYTQIYRYEDDDQTIEFDSDEVFSTTCHETAHTSHYRLGAFAFMGVGGLIRESWATAVEWALTHDEYFSRGILNYGEPTFTAPDLSFPNNFGFQIFQSNLTLPDLDYTPLFIDLIDNENQWQVPYTFGFAGTVRDDVTGYTIAGLENEIIKNIGDRDQLRNQLVAHAPAGVTANQITELLSFYY